MAAEKPIIYIFHGDDAYSMEKALDKMISNFGDPTTADLNTTRLDGRTAKLGEMRTAATTMPFLAERRLVILSHPLAHLQGKEAQKNFGALLEQIPASTAMVLLIDDHWKNRYQGGEWRVVWDVLKKSHWLVKWVGKNDSRAIIRDFKLPGSKSMHTWIQKQVKEQGGQISTGAAQTLSAYVGSDTQLAIREIEKLLTYVNYERPVESHDVELLSTSMSQVSVFDMIDSMAMRNTQTALSLMQQLLEQEDAFRLFGMIVRQFRLLIQAREILDEGGSAAQIQRELGGPKFVAEKLDRQARSFTAAKLADIYHQLLELDEGIKTSQISPEVGMNLFIAEIGR